MGLLLAEEQQEELLLDSSSSAVEAVSRRLRPSLSLPLLQLLTEQTSWQSVAVDKSGGGASAAESRRRHRLVCLSNVQLGLMAQKSSSWFSSSWKEEG